MSGYHVISGPYTQAMSIPLLSGRAFAETDNENSPRVALISRYMAEHYWPQQDALGKRFKLGLPQANGPLVAVIGIVGDAKQAGIDVDVKSDFYLHYLQFPGSETGVVVKSASEHAVLRPTLQSQVSAIDKDEPI